MSLEAIRHMRLSGRKPSVVFVVLGTIPQNHVDDDAGVILIRPGDRPEAMDWRPVIGVHLVLIQAQVLPDLLLSVIDAASRAGATFYGLANQHETHPLAAEAGERDHAYLRRAWERLCL